MIDPGFLAKHTSEAKLRDGTRVILRPVVPEDAAELAHAVQQLSPEARYYRFMAPVSRLTDAQLRYLTELDYVDHFAWVAMLADDPAHPGIGVSRYVRDPAEPDAAEAAVAVLDAYQGLGLGTLLLEALAIEATHNGIARFRGTALAGNRRIIEVLEGLGTTLSHPSGGEITFELQLPGRIDELRRSPMYRALRAAAREPHPPFRHPTPRPGR